MFEPSMQKPFEASVVAAGITYYPYEDGYDMKGATVFTMQGKCDNGTVTTIEATMSKKTDTTKEWVDITKSFTNMEDSTTSTSYTDIDTILQVNGINVERIRIKSVTIASSTVYYAYRVM